MLSRTIDVDGLKVFCGEGGAPGPWHFDIEIDYVAAPLGAGYGHVFSDFRSSPQ